MAETTRRLVFYPQFMDNFRKSRECDETEFATVQAKIVYFGTPVALISSMNRDGSPNLAPISWFWALVWTITLGLLTETQPLKNFRMCPDRVIDLPSADMWNDHSQDKTQCHRRRRCNSVSNRTSFEFAGFSTIPSETVVTQSAATAPGHAIARLSQAPARMASCYADTC